MENEIVIFTAKNTDIILNVPIADSTVWLSQAQMTELFEVDRTVITRHVNNVFKENELSRESNVQKMHIANSDRPVQLYSLDVVISVGYRVKSKRGVEFRQWAHDVLKQYIIEGYAVNENRLKVLQKTIDIQSKMLADALDIEASDILAAVNNYTEALALLDQYDYQSLCKPDGTIPIYKITYEDCRMMVDNMEDTFKSDVFGVEKEPGKIEGILAAVFQDVFGGEVYPSMEEKAANLLYFMVKDHPFADDVRE